MKELDVFDYNLRTANYRRCQQVRAKRTVEGMSEKQKQAVLESLHAQQDLCNSEGQQYNTEMLHYVECLLKGGNNEVHAT